MPPRPPQAGVLYLVATPIGNLEDLSFRAVRVLGQVDLVAAEDTRKAQILLGHYGIATPTVSFFAGNEARRTAQLVGRLHEGASVALISEAGMPGISDPGERLVRRCLAEGLAVDAIPGATALTMALVLSGLPTERFRWLGFLPRKGRARREQIAEIARSPDTVVIYEAPGRVGATLAELLAALGPRPAVLARELTKLHQELVRGTLDELAARYAEAVPRGEVTLVIGGADETDPDPERLRAAVQALLDQGQSPRSIAEALGPRFGRRPVYQLALQLSRPGHGAPPSR